MSTSVSGPFSGMARTLSSESPKRSSTSFEVSEEDWSTTMSELDSFYSDIMMKNAPTKKAFVLEVKNNVPISPMALRTKESRGAVSKLSSKLQGLVHVTHSIMYLMYIPTILESTAGLLTIKLFNTATGETIDVDTDAPANEAAIFVTRWPRSLCTTDGKYNGLHLLVSCSASCNQGALVGKMFPFWDDSLHKKMLYQREYPSLRFPIEKTAAVSAIDDAKLLVSFAIQRVMPGQGKIDVEPHVISSRNSESKKAVTVVPLKSDARMKTSVDEIPAVKTEGFVSDKANVNVVDITGV